MVEQDGTVSYSAVISFASGVKGLDISIRSNYINNGTANLFITSGKTMPVTINVTGVPGKILMKKAMAASAGTGTYQVNVSVLAKGVYYISVSDKSRMNTQQIVIE